MSEDAFTKLSMRYFNYLYIIFINYRHHFSQLLGKNTGNIKFIILNTELNFSDNLSFHITVMNLITMMTIMITERF